jgi:hypothetical protein
MLIDFGSGFVPFTGTTLNSFDPVNNTFQISETTTFTSLGGPGNPVPPGPSASSLIFFEYSNDNWTTGSAAVGLGLGTNGVWMVSGGQSAVPEPSTWALGGLGALALLLHRRRSRRLQ